MVNYGQDHEVEENYELGWTWLEVETGPQIASYSGFHISVSSI